MIDAKNIIKDFNIPVAKQLDKKIISSSNRRSFNNTLESVLKNNGRMPQDKVKDKKLMDACIEMESIFVGKMFKEMRNTIHKNELLHGGFAEEIFEDMLYDEYALNVSRKSNLGLANMIYNELSKNNG